MATNRAAPPNPSDLLRRLLDGGYTNATGPVIRAISRDTTNGPLATRLNQLDDHARQMAENGETLRADDPVLRAVIADFGDALKRQGLLIDAVSGDVQQTGFDAAGQFFRQTTLPGMSPALARAGFNNPDPAAINAAVMLTAGETWKHELAAYGDIAEQVRLIAIKGIVAGYNPRKIANEIRAGINGIPAARANNLMRTLQLQSYRVATAANQDANRDILAYSVRISALDGRTCLACVALHGTKLPVGAMIHDHHQGRCTSIAVVKGREQEILFQRYIGDEPVIVRNGQEWWDKLPDAQKLEMAGPGLFEALGRGEIQLRDLVQPYRDPLFGDMIRQAGLKGALANPNRTVLTVNGEVMADRGTPGTTLDSLTTFVENSNGPLGQALMDWQNQLMGYDENGHIVINKGQVQSAARNFVRESQDIQYAKDYVIGLVRQQAEENGLMLTQHEAERVYNQHYANQARAILLTANASNTRLTEAQRRRLETAISGRYLDMVYTTDSSLRGSLANAGRRSRGGGASSSSMTNAAKQAKRREFLDYMGRLP